MGKLDNKVIITVGATSGIGEAAARLFAKEGAISILTGRRTENGEKIAAEIVSDGYKAEYIHLDVNDYDEQKSVLQTVASKYGRIDVLYYNAGISGNQDWDTMTPEFWDTNLDTDLKSLFFMTQAALPYLKESKGNILYTTSTAGVDAKQAGTGVAYASAKAGVCSLTRQLGLNFAQYGIRVNAIAPGVTLTPILDGLPEDVMDWLRKGVPLGFIAEPIDQAYAALFLVSDEAKYITGQVLVVAGGADL